MTKRPMVVKLGESNIFERQMAHAFERGVYVCGAALNVCKQRTELVFTHPCQP